MPRRILVAPEIQQVGDLGQLLGSFLRHLTAGNAATATLSAYRDAVTQLTRFLEREGMPLLVRHLTREHIESFVTEQLQLLKPATAVARYRGCRAFFNWLVEEGELVATPMARMREPRHPATIATILTDEQIKGLFRLCSGVGFEDRRDTALIRFLVDTGVRAAECCGLALEDVDLDRGVALVRHTSAKGGKERLVPFGQRTTRDLDRYLRERSRHRAAGESAFWLGQRGPLRRDGLEALLRRLGQQAGFRLHPHLFRHYWTHALLQADTQEGDVMRLAGWSTRDMLQRYAAARATERAIQSHRQRSPGDRI